MAQSWEETLGTDGRNIDLALAQADENIQNLTSGLTARDLIIADRDQTIAALRAELEACRPSTAVLGVSAPQNTPGGDKLRTAGERIFFDPGKHYPSVGNSGMLYNALNRLVEGGTLWHSFKDRAGQWTRDLYTDIHNRWPSVKVLATAHHEPFDNFNYRVSSDWARWVSLQIAMEDAVWDLPWVKMVTIVEAYHVPSRTPGYFDSVWRDRQIFGADSYNPGIGTPKRYVPPVEVHAELAEYCDEHKNGQKLYIGETGVGIVAPDTPTSRLGRTQWIKDNRDYMRVHADVAMWWNSGGPGPMNTCRLEMPDLQLWLESV